MPRRRWKTGCLGIAGVAAGLAAIAAAFVYVQAQRTPPGVPEYVALGSSFAAGPGLGALQNNSPLMCARTIDSYPQKLARAARLSLVDMSCGGAVTSHLYHGGQLFQGPQLRVVGPATRLVTITVGGNDIGYIGDLSMLASRRSRGVYGWLVRHLWGGPKAWADRDFARLDRELGEVFGAIRRRSPAARIVVATYPTILPPAGTCALLSISAAEAQAMRRVGDRLAAVTAAAARRARAAVVDMNGLAAAHHACSAEPWVSGWTNGGIAPFHPTQAGTTATADAIRRAIAHQQL